MVPFRERTRVRLCVICRLVRTGTCVILIRARLRSLRRLCQTCEILSARFYRVRVLDDPVCLNGRGRALCQCQLFVHSSPCVCDKYTFSQRSSKISHLAACTLRMRPSGGDK